MGSRYFPIDWNSWSSLQDRRMKNPRGWRNVDPEPRVGPAEGRKKKVTPAILMAELTTSATEMVSDATLD